ncbi:MAG: 50S ribosomal protein L25 [Desulfatiglandales bacterium]
MDQFRLPARVRDRKGKSAVRKLRKEQQVPAVFYGPAREPVLLAVGCSDLQGLIKQSNIENVIIGLEISSESGTETRNVMVKELQTNPVKDTTYHVDFYEISMDKAIQVDIPINLVNTPVGVSDGGVLQLIQREISISAMPGKLVEQIDVDVSGLHVGDALRLGDIQLPEGVTASMDDQLTIAVVAAPAVSDEKAEEEGEVTEEQGQESETQPDEE